MGHARVVLSHVGMLQNVFNHVNIKGLYDDIKLA